MAHSTVIANEFLNRAKSNGKTLTQMQLQKLVYIAHGWHLALFSSPLTDDSPQAWDYGPVYPELWEALRKYGRSVVDSPIKIGDFGIGAFDPDCDKVVSATLSNEKETLLDKVFELYGEFHAFQLSALTHKEDTPWYEVFVNSNQKKGVINNELIRGHFVEIGKSRSAA